jgi:CheY-like chemotaxis protein
MAKILVIDDDPDIVTAVRMTLESAKHQVVTATSGEQGLEKVKAEKPEMIIMDVMMETHTAGFQLALKLHSPDPSSELKEFKDIPILMLTAIHSTTPLHYEPILTICRWNCSSTSPLIRMTCLAKLIGCLRTGKHKCCTPLNSCPSPDGGRELPLPLECVPDSGKGSE